MVPSRLISVSSLKSMRRPLRLPRDRRGVTSIEYAIIASLIILALVVSVPGVAPSISHTFNTVTQIL